MVISYLCSLHVETDVTAYSLSGSAMPPTPEEIVSFIEEEESYTGTCVTEATYAGKKDHEKKG